MKIFQDFLVLFDAELGEAYNFSQTQSIVGDYYKKKPGDLLKKE